MRTAVREVADELLDKGSYPTPPSPPARLVEWSLDPRRLVKGAREVGGEYLRDPRWKTDPRIVLAWARAFRSASASGKAKAVGWLDGEILRRARLTSRSRSLEESGACPESIRKLPSHLGRVFGFPVRPSLPAGVRIPHSPIPPEIVFLSFGDPKLRTAIETELRRTRRARGGARGGRKAEVAKRYSLVRTAIQSYLERQRVSSKVYLLEHPWEFWNALKRAEPGLVVRKYGAKRAQYGYRSFLSSVRSIRQDFFSKNARLA